MQRFLRYTGAVFLAASLLGLQQASLLPSRHSYHHCSHCTESYCTMLRCSHPDHDGRSRVLPKPRASAGSSFGHPPHAERLANSPDAFRVAPASEPVLNTCGATPATSAVTLDKFMPPDLTTCLQLSNRIVRPMNYPLLVPQLISTDIFRPPVAQI